MAALIFINICTLLFFPFIIETAVTLDHDAARGRL